MQNITLCHTIHPPFERNVDAVAGGTNEIRPEAYSFLKHRASNDRKLKVVLSVTRLPRKRVRVPVQPSDWYI